VQRIASHGKKPSKGQQGRAREGKGEGRVGPLQLGTLDMEVEEEREGKRAGGGAWVGSSMHFFFPL